LAARGKPRRLTGAFFDSISILLQWGKLMGQLQNSKNPFVMC
jgi:hypothetical protein